MDRERVMDFTRRISQCNRSGLTLITYEILFAYLEDMKQAHGEQNQEEFKQSAHEVTRCINQLINTLNFEYGIAGQLYPIYQYCKEQIAMSLIKNDLSGANLAEKLLKELYEAFSGVAKEDMSLPLMQNSEQVIAGMTYQKDQLSEYSVTGEEKRGFLA